MQIPDREVTHGGRCILFELRKTANYQPRKSACSSLGLKILVRYEEKQLKADPVRRQLLTEADEAPENPLNSECVLSSAWKHNKKLNIKAHLNLIKT